MFDPSVTLCPGQHVCCVVNRAEERAYRIASWTREGFQAGERVVYIEPRGHGDAFLRCLDHHGVDWKGPARQGQLVVCTPGEAKLGRGSDQDRRVSEHAEFVEQSLKAGYAAVRMSVEARVVLAALRDIGALLAYESRLEELCSTRPVSVLCFYDRKAFGSHLKAAAGAHPHALVEGQVQAWTAPGRVWLRGEVDISNVELVGALLARAAAEGGELAVHLADLSFIDIAGTSQLIELARRLSPHEQLRIIDPPPQLPTILQVIGWHAPNLTVEEVAS